LAVSTVQKEPTFVQTIANLQGGPGGNWTVHYKSHSIIHSLKINSPKTLKD